MPNPGPDPDLKEQQPEQLEAASGACDTDPQEQPGQQETPTSVCDSDPKEHSEQQATPAGVCDSGPKEPPVQQETAAGVCDSGSKEQPEQQETAAIVCDSGPKEQPEQQEADEETRVFLHCSSKHVERRPGNLVVKYGTELKESEHRALAFAHSLNLPVPRLHDDLPHPKPDSNTVCMWMDYVDGDILEDVWPSMTEEQKVDIAKQLGDIVSAMRRQKSTTGRIEAIGGGELHFLRTYNSHMGGPFPNEVVFQQWQAGTLYKETPKAVRDAIARGLHQRSFNHQVVFTHGDLSQHNIIVKDNRIQALVDWEYAGWFPEHYEYVEFLGQTPTNRDWRHYGHHIFAQEYPDDLVAYEAMKRWQNPW